MNLKVGQEKVNPNNQGLKILKKSRDHLKSFSISQHMGNLNTQKNKKKKWQKKMPEEMLAKLLTFGKSH